MITATAPNVKRCDACHELRPWLSFSRTYNGCSRRNTCNRCRDGKKSKTAVRARVKRWQKFNPEMMAAQRARYRERYPAKICFYANRRRAQQLQATPAWADEDAIRFMYLAREAAEELLGVPVEVDHFIPLQSPTVCGLHCEDNLRLLHASANRIKSNHYVGG